MIIAVEFATFQNPEEMFKNIFSNMDPDILGKFLSTAPTEFTEILMNDETKSFGDIFTLFNKDDFIEKGSDVMKYYLKKYKKLIYKTLNGINRHIV